MEITHIKKELDRYIKSLSVKKRKSSGKKYFYDSDNFLVMDITQKSRMVYTHKILYPMLEGYGEKEMSNIIVEILHNNGHNVNGVIFLSYDSEKELFGKIQNGFGSDLSIVSKFLYDNMENSRGEKVSI